MCSISNYEMQLINSISVKIKSQPTIYKNYGVLNQNYNKLRKFNHYISVIHLSKRFWLSSKLMYP